MKALSKFPFFRYQDKPKPPVKPECSFSKAVDAVADNLEKLNKELDKATVIHLKGSDHVKS